MAGTGLETPLIARRRMPRIGMSSETFGRLSEGFARFMGTPAFLVGMTLFCAAWLGWNTWAPEALQFDPKTLNYTLLTLILSLQASYAAPLILLAENRSADRDRVEFENDRQRAERTLADTEYLTREIASLRIAIREVATRDFVRSELRSALEELDQARTRPRTPEGPAQRACTCGCHTAPTAAAAPASPAPASGAGTDPTPPEESTEPHG